MDNWKDIPNIPHYQASYEGKIKRLSYSYFNRGVEKVRPELIRQPSLSHRYYRITIFNKRYLVHRLIGITHVPNPLNLPYLNHKDGNRLNNHADNLEWCTSSENAIHAYKNKLRIAHPTYGEKNKFSKLDASDIISIRSLYETGKYTYAALGELFNVHSTNIYQIIKRITWNHI